MTQSMNLLQRDKDYLIYVLFVHLDVAVMINWYRNLSIVCLRGVQGVSH